MLKGDAYSSGHLVPSHLEIAKVLLVETDLLPNLSFFFRTMLFEYPFRYFIDFALLRRSLVRFWPEVPPVFISLIINVSFLLSNWLEMHKMRCIRQVNKNYFAFFAYFYRNYDFGILGVCWRKSRAILLETNVDIKQLWTFIYFLWNALGS